MLELDNHLTTFERAELVMAEDAIRAGLDSFIRVGEALASIRDKRLYRETHATFADYCEDQWRLSSRYVNYQIAASEVANSLGTIVPSDQMPANEAQVRPLTRLEPEQQREAWSRAVETAPDGKVTAKHVESVVREMVSPAPAPANDDLEIETISRVQNVPVIVRAPDPVISQPVATPRGALHSSASNEWYTPARYADAAREVMGGIDLDPASNALANQTIKATRYYDQAANGFDKPWTGRVFLNPPYGKEDGDSNQARWSARLVEQYKAGVTTEAVLLVNATTDREWFGPLWDYLVCFTDHRIRFYAPDGEGNSPTHGNAFVYLGPHTDRFAAVFGAFGVIAHRYA